MRGVDSVLWGDVRMKGESEKGEIPCDAAMQTFGVYDTFQICAGVVSFVGVNEIEQVAVEKGGCLVSQMSFEDGVDETKGEVSGEECPV